jgi:hypothetical protein
MGSTDSNIQLASPVRQCDRLQRVMAETHSLGEWIDVEKHPASKASISSDNLVSLASHGSQQTRIPETQRMTLSNDSSVSNSRRNSRRFSFTTRMQDKPATQNEAAQRSGIAAFPSGCWTVNAAVETRVSSDNQRYRGIHHAARDSVLFKRIRR